MNGINCECPTVAVLVVVSSVFFELKPLHFDVRLMNFNPIMLIINAIVYMLMSKLSLGDFKIFALLFHVKSDQG